MYPASRYIGFWEVKLPDGNPCGVEVQLTPTGFYNMYLASFWTHLFASLRVDNEEALRRFTPEQLELDFSPNDHLNERESS